MPGSEPNTSDCRGCGATILWIKSRNNKNVPLDSEPIRVRLVEREVEHDEEGFNLDGERVYGVTDPKGDTDLYRCHFETCPKASDFKRPRAQGRPAPAKATGTSMSQAFCPHCGAVIYITSNLFKEDYSKPATEEAAPF